MRQGASPASPDRLELSNNFSPTSGQRLELITREADPPLFATAHIDQIR